MFGIRTDIAKVLQRLQYVSAYLEAHASLVAVPAVEHPEEHATEACLHDLHAAHLCVSYARVTQHMWWTCTHWFRNNM